MHNYRINGATYFPGYAPPEWLRAASPAAERLWAEYLTTREPLAAIAREKAEILARYRAIGPLRERTVADREAEAAELRPVDARARRAAQECHRALLAYDDAMSSAADADARRLLAARTALAAQDDAAAALKALKAALARRAEARLYAGPTVAASYQQSGGIVDGRARSLSFLPAALDSVEVAVKKFEVGTLRDVVDNGGAL